MSIDTAAISRIVRLCRLIIPSISVLFFAYGLLFAHTLSAKESVYTIGFPEDDTSSDWRNAQLLQVEQELAKYPNVRFLRKNAGGSIAQNILDIESMVAQGAQLLFLAPRYPEALQPVVKAIRKKGVKIILLTRKLNSEDYDVYIGPDDFQIAESVAELIAERLRGHGRVLMLEGVATTTTAQLRKQGFLAGIKRHAGIQVITKTANYSRSDAIRVMEELVRDAQKFDAIFAQNDAMAAGARLALKNAGRDPSKIPITGIDYTPEARYAILSHEQLASFTYPLCGKEGVAAAMAILRGEPVPRTIVIPSTRITSKNVNSVATVY